ncbi:MAG TPA: hypothetical protein VN923_16525, partial [Thermoanaerobaculia bacterium]|nr:hypothetical protein [Thermoanaerobaculia bacterium]
MAEAWSFAELESAVVLVKANCPVALVVVAVTLTVTVTVALAPAARLPSAQLTVVPGVQLPALALAETMVLPAGGWKCTTTDCAVSAPPLWMVPVKVACAQLAP